MTTPLSGYTQIAELIENWANRLEGHEFEPELNSLTELADEMHAFGNGLRDEVERFESVIQNARYGKMDAVSKYPLGVCGLSNDHYRHEHHTVHTTAGPWHCDGYGSRSTQTPEDN